MFDSEDVKSDHHCISNLPTPNAQELCLETFKQMAGSHLYLYDSQTKHSDRTTVTGKPNSPHLPQNKSYVPV